MAHSQRVLNSITSTTLITKPFARKNSSVADSSVAHRLLKNIEADHLKSLGSVSAASMSHLLKVVRQKTAVSFLNSLHCLEIYTSGFV